MARPSRAFAILVSTSSGSPSTVESREASALASALPRRAASRAAVVTAPRRAVEIFESTSKEVSTADCRAYAVRALASALEACSPEMVLASSEASADGPQESVGHLGVHLQRRDPRRYVQGVLVHHRLEAVVGGHRGQRGVVGRGDGAVHGRRGAVVCSAAMLLPCAATCPSVVARAAAVARGAIAGASALLSSLEASSAVTLSSRDWMAAALLPDAAVFTARSVT